MILVEDLWYAHDGVPTLRGISLTIDRGEWVILAGRNGSGKTTLVRHFNALHEPDRGRVTVDGTCPSTDPVHARTTVGMVFQSPRDQFVAATVGPDVAFGPENLGLGHDEIDRRVADALEAVDMQARTDERIDTLSDGEQARVAVAGALAMEPDYLVLDEPFAGLDWPAYRSLLSHLDALYDGGTAIVLVTHDLRDVIDRADRIIGLEDGSVAVAGQPSTCIDALEGIGVRGPE